MNIDRSLLEHVAEVARLKLTEEEIGKFLPQLMEALEFFSQLQEVNTENVNPSFQPVEIKNVMREDIVTHKSGQFSEDLLNLAPHRDGKYLKVKKILK